MALKPGENLETVVKEVVKIIEEKIKKGEIPRESKVRMKKLKS